MESKIWKINFCISLIKEKIINKIVRKEKKREENRKNKRFTLIWKELIAVDGQVTKAPAGSVVGPLTATVPES